MQQRWVATAIVRALLCCVIAWAVAIGPLGRAQAQQVLELEGCPDGLRPELERLLGIEARSGNLPELWQRSTARVRCQRGVVEVQLQADGTQLRRELALPYGVRAARPISLTIVELADDLSAELERQTALRADAERKAEAARQAERAAEAERRAEAERAAEAERKAEAERAAEAARKVEVARRQREREATEGAAQRAFEPGGRAWLAAGARMSLDDSPGFLWTPALSADYAVEPSLTVGLRASASLPRQLAASDLAVELTRFGVAASAGVVPLRSGPLLLQLGLALGITVHHASIDGPSGFQQTAAATELSPLLNLDVSLLYFPDAHFGLVGRLGADVNLGIPRFGYETSSGAEREIVRAWPLSPHLTVGAVYAL